MTEGMTARKPRSDGLRNRAMIVAVAREHFRDHGTSASLEAIGRTAGVGPGTLYRHFPTRDDLIAAVLALRDGEVVERLEAIEELPDAALALEEWIAAVEVYLDTLNDLVGPIGRALSDEGSPIAVSCQWLIEASDRVVDRAQGVGAVAVDLRGKDVLYAAFAIAWARRTAGEDVRSADAVQRIVMRGLRRA
jgi:AcrR family transcriptional regulator